MLGKSSFSRLDADQIRFLLRKKAGADQTRQKLIRDEMRGLGFYITDFDNSRKGFIVTDFEALIHRGIITIMDDINQKATRTAYRNTSDIKDKDRNKDEEYVIDLCDEVLGEKAKRHYNKFEFLIGDTGRNLPVDAYYESFKLVVEYRERQHTEVLLLFDKPDKMTVSGVHRGEQRRLYDEKRRKLLPEHGIALVELDYSDFKHNSEKRLIRDPEKDLNVIRSRLSKYLVS